MIRQLKQACVVSALFGLASLGLAAPAQAALIHNFVDRSAGNAVIGSIEFSADTPGTVIAFNLDTTGFGGPVLGLSELCGPGGSVCEQVGIVGTTWSIDGAWNLTDLDLRLDLESFFAGAADAEISLFFQNPASAGVSGSLLSSDCFFAAACFSYHNALFDRLATSAVEMAEPATLALFGFGLAGLGLAVRRRRRDANSA